MQVEGSPSYLAITLPDRKNPEYGEVLSLLKQWSFRLEPSNRKWWLRDRHRTLNFLAEHWDELESQFAADFTAGFQERMAKVRRVRSEAQVREVGEGEFEVEMKLLADGLNESELHRALVSSSGFVESGQEVFLFDAKQVEPLRQAQQALTNEPDRELAPRVKVRLGSADLHAAEEILEELPEGFAPPKEWKRRSAALRDISKLEPAPVQAELDNRLRNYQRIGVAWMWHLFRQEIGGILADEMGLGKTVQALALLQSLRSRDTLVPGPCLVVCPASLCENWRRETLRFAPDFKVQVHRGAKRAKQADAFTGVDLILVSYPLLARDLALFQEMRFACVAGGGSLVCYTFWV